MEIIFTEHLKLRLKLRKFPDEIVKKIYLEAENRYFDKETENFIAVKKLMFKQKERDLMVAYLEIENKVILLTIHPLKLEQKENRVNKGRWEPL